MDYALRWCCVLSGCVCGRLGGVRGARPVSRVAAASRSACVGASAAWGRREAGRPAVRVTAALWRLLRRAGGVRPPYGCRTTPRRHAVLRAATWRHCGQPGQRSSFGDFFLYQITLRTQPPFEALQGRHVRRPGPPGPNGAPSRTARRVKRARSCSQLFLLSLRQKMGYFDAVFSQCPSNPKGCVRRGGARRSSGRRFSN